MLGGLLVAAFCANRLSRRTRVPDLIPAGVVLALLGYGFTFAIVSGIGLWFLHLPLNLSLLLGGVFGCTSSTMVLPTLQQLEVRGPVKVVLLLGSCFG